MDQDIINLINKPHVLFPVLIAVVMVVSSVMRGISSSVKHVGERTRREIAAYIAEGSINADQGERLLKADPRNTSSCG